MSYSLCLNALFWYKMCNICWHWILKVDAHCFIFSRMDQCKHLAFTVESSRSSCQIFLWNLETLFLSVRGWDLTATKLCRIIALQKDRNCQQSTKNEKGTEHWKDLQFQLGTAFLRYNTLHFLLVVSFREYKERYDQREVIFIGSSFTAKPAPWSRPTTKSTDRNSFNGCWQCQCSS